MATNLKAKPNSLSMEKGEILAIPASSNLSAEELLGKISKMEGVQVFDADAIAGPNHVRLALFHSLMAFETKRNISKRMGIELLLRAACTRQIKIAIETVGVKDPGKVVIGAVGKKKELLLKALGAKERPWAIDNEKVANKFGLEPSKHLEEQIIRRMVELQVSD